MSYGQYLQMEQHMNVHENSIFLEEKPSRKKKYVESKSNQYKSE